MSIDASVNDRGFDIVMFKEIRAATLAHAISGIDRAEETLESGIIIGTVTTPDDPAAGLPFYPRRNGQVVRFMDVQDIDRARIKERTSVPHETATFHEPLVTRANVKKL